MTCAESPPKEMQSIYLQRSRTRSPRRTKGASRREAAVTAAPQQGIAPNPHGHTSPKERTSLFPATLHKRARARRFSQRSRRPLHRPPSRRQGAAALSAAVTTAPQQGIAPNSHGYTSPKEHTSLFPATLRERGSGGEALLLEKRPLPQLAFLISQTIRLRRGAGGWRLEGWGERLCQSRARSRRRGRDRGRRGAGKRCAARRRD